MRVGRGSSGWPGVFRRIASSPPTFRYQILLPLLLDRPRLVSYSLRLSCSLLPQRSCDLRNAATALRKLRALSDRTERLLFHWRPDGSTDWAENSQPARECSCVACETL